MNNDEATQVLDTELARYRTESYADLIGRISDTSIELERTAASGTRYQIEIQFLWDNRTGGDVRVMGSIDDGSWRALFPLNRSFIKSADGSFVGE